jgi:hypothetical protein
MDEEMVVGLPTLERTGLLAGLSTPANFLGGKSNEAPVSKEEMNVEEREKTLDLSIGDLKVSGSSEELEFKSMDDHLLILDANLAFPELSVARGSVMEVL